MVDIFYRPSGAFVGRRQSDRRRSLELIQNSPYIQMAGTDNSRAYNDQMTDLLGMKPGDAVMWSLALG